MQNEIPISDVSIDELDRDQQQQQLSFAGPQTGIYALYFPSKWSFNELTTFRFVYFLFFFLFLVLPSLSRVYSEIFNMFYCPSRSFPLFMAKENGIWPNFFRIFFWNFKIFLENFIVIALKSIFHSSYSVVTVNLRAFLKNFGLNINSATFFPLSSVLICCRIYVIP